MVVIGLVVVAGVVGWAFIAIGVEQTGPTSTAGFVLGAINAVICIATLVYRVWRGRRATSQSQVDNIV